MAFITGGNFVRKARIKRGRNVKISPTAFFKFPENIEIGDNSFINHLCSVWAAPNAKITIGRDVLFGPNTVVVAANHGIAADRLIREQPGVDRDIIIGNDVWIAANVVVTGGVTIGDGCVVGAGAVVTRNLPPYSICAGVPARVIGKRSADDKTMSSAAARDQRSA
ncbi:MAG: acyltransferase [Alphaproteobacteria bacterium]|nr:acyltransferase [Alphaproteobacteria bacterium]